jgi:hypothetical protein
MNALIKPVTTSIGIIIYLNGLFTIWQTNMLFLFPPDSKISEAKEFKIHSDENNEVDVSFYTHVNDTIKVKNKPAPKPGLKCRFCNLKYCLEEERNEHEEFWHSNKVIKL